MFWNLQDYFPKVVFAPIKRKFHQEEVILVMQ